jgi:hypothetical protein
VANAINGRPALRFENTKTWLQGSVTTADGLTGGLTAFVVFTPAGTTNKTLISAGNGSIYFSMNDDSINFPSPTVNGVVRKVFRGSAASPLTDLMIGDTIQYGAGNYNGLTGDIAEILVYKDISLGTAALVEDYLDTKYGLAHLGTVVNGSFEYPAVTGYQYNPGPTLPEFREKYGWFFANGAIIQANDSDWHGAPAPNGIQTAVLQGTGTMSQTIDLAAGTYTLKFKAARRNGQVQPLKIRVDSAQIGSVLTPSGDAFEDFATTSFTVSVGKHTIRFESTDGSGDKSIFIDDVRLVLSTPRERLLSHFGLRQGDAGWNAADDLNGDGIINAADISLQLRQ